MIMAFTKKKMAVIFTLTNPAGSTGSGGSEQIVVQGLRMSCKIVKTASPQMNSCQLRIFGLPPETYSKIVSIYQSILGVQKNLVTIQAGDEKSTNLGTAFIGQIVIAHIDLNQQPDAVVDIIAQTAYMQALQPVDAIQFPDRFDVATALKGLANTMNMGFEPNGVKMTLPRMTLQGSPRQQAIAIAEAADIVISFDDNKMVIFTSGGKRINAKPPLISPATGMIGYPYYSTNGIGLKTLYNPTIKWGADVQVQSSLAIPNLNGLWTVSNLVHTLECELPNGRWDTEIQAYNFQNIRPATTQVQAPL